MRSRGPTSGAPSVRRWVPIERVEYAPAHVSGEWSTSGVIRIKPGKDAGLLFHEVFHPKSGDRDGAWAEAFCDAFRYYAEREFLPPPESKWARHIDRLASMSEERALKGRKDWVKLKYHYPAALIVKRLGGPNGSIESLRALWFQLLDLRRQRGGPVMDDFFGFAPPLHKSDLR
jgi:hypothetical protein